MGMVSRFIFYIHYLIFQKKKTGFYYLIEFEASGNIIKDLEVEFKREERIIRWQTIKLEKYAKEYAETRKKKLSTNKKDK